MKSIILAGGSGTRLWPISLKLMPKQFVKLFDNHSLFQKMILRNKNISESQDDFIRIKIEDILKILKDTIYILLISKKESSQKLKEVVKQLKLQNPELSNTHLTIHRPWGTYRALDSGSGYKIKSIEVKPGKRLSLQKQFYRNKYWVVVSGTAHVTVGKNTYLVRPNESTYIKMGQIYRLENLGKILVVMLEVQVGSYIDEDDIMRIEDDFKRS